MKLRTYAEFGSDLPEDQIEDGAEIVQYGGKSVAEALRGILGQLGCELGALGYAGEHGWEFRFSYRNRPLWCQVTLIEGYLAIFEDSFGSKAADHPDFAEIMDLLGDALAADARFRDVGWFYPDEALSGVGGAIRPAEGPNGLPQADFGGGAWSDLSPHPLRRCLARLFDLFVVAGPVSSGAFFLLALPVSRRGQDLPDALVALGILFAPGWLAVSALLNAFLLRWTSTTAGKWLCGVKIVRKDARPMTFGLALKREAEALIAGYALGVPLISLIAMFSSFADLVGEGATSWDERRGLVAVQRPNTLWQLFLAFLALSPFVAITAYLLRLR